MAAPKNHIRLDDSYKGIAFPEGDVRMAFVDAPSYKYDDDGVYSAKVAYKIDDNEEPEYDEEGNPTNTAAIIELCDRAASEGLAEIAAMHPPGIAKKITKADLYVYEEDPETGEGTGYITVAFKQKAILRFKKDGQDVEKALIVKLFNSDGTPREESVWRGAKIMVNASINRVSYIPKDKEVVVSRDLAAVMVTEEADAQSGGGSTAESYGFGGKVKTPAEGAGFKKKSEPKPKPDLDDEIPF